MPITLTPEQIAAILFATTITLPGAVPAKPAAVASEKSEEETPEYAPSGTIAESKDVYEGKPDSRGRTTWYVRCPLNSRHSVD
jgi:hypothetical protein